ncbi:MAG TPA: VCBS repeat-containing protein, partial [Bryobacteraceae bacterium]|nr:VCBS repeat-containing protein [Bryobacteraceae bacterium]
GDIYYYANSSATGLALEGRRHAVDTAGVALRHPLAGCYPIAYPAVSGAGDDIIAGGEGALYHYKFAGRFDKQGRPVYQRPVPVLQSEAELFAGSLAVPTIVDWDGDGVLDIVAGNSEGRILFFRNLGASRQPALAPGVALTAGGREIHIQPGYKGDIQGPGEARWGYVSPNVFDWNGDGLPDILASDSTARHYVYLNTGTRRAPKLAHDQTIYLDGLDLHGTWRVRPGIAKWGNRVAYITLDDQDEFHLYWRMDDFNVTDGGKLHMEDGSAIHSNFIFAGGTGRSKIELTDWDGDGVLDLLVGTPKHHSIPNPETGLPRALGMPGTMILFLKNTGTNDAPKFRFPVGLKHDGATIHLGHHEIGASTGPMGPGKGHNIVVSREDGRLLFFQRERMKE